MTFTEAALEVLRSVGEPLHYKRITELAIERNLLSHVGKTPEVTMSSRLATMVKKDRGSAPIIKVKPGVFAIRADAKLDAAVFAEAAALDDECEAGVPSEAPPDPTASEPDSGERAALPGSDVFPEEDDDDDPILAGLEVEESDGGDERGRRRRRRRRRRSSDNEEGTNGDSRPRERERERGRERRRAEPREAGPRLEWSREPGDGDLLGRGLADAAYAVLSRAERQPASFARVADMLVQRGRLQGQGAALAPTLAAALRAEVLGTPGREGRARFLLRDGQVLLTEWLLPSDMVRAEEAAARQGERQREQARLAWVARIGELPVAGFAELIATWLNAEGVSALRAVRRPGSGPQEFHFAGVRRRGPEEERLAIAVLRGARELDRDAVQRVRGALHHYGNATCGWIVSTGHIAAGAREEVSAIGAAPIALFDGLSLAAAMESRGIGLRPRPVTICELDFDLLEALGGDLRLPAAREREREPREREPRESREGERDRRRRRRGRNQADGGERDTVAAGGTSGPERPESDVQTDRRWDRSDPGLPEDEAYPASNGLEVVSAGAESGSGRRNAGVAGAALAGGAAAGAALSAVDRPANGGPALRDVSALDDDEEPAGSNDSVPDPVPVVHRLRGATAASLDHADDDTSEEADDEDNSLSAEDE